MFHSSLRMTIISYLVSCSLKMFNFCIDLSIQQLYMRLLKVYLTYAKLFLYLFELNKILLDLLSDLM